MRSRQGLHLIMLVVIFGSIGFFFNPLVAGEQPVQQVESSTSIIANFGQQSLEKNQTVADRYRIETKYIYKNLYKGFSGDIPVSQLGDFIEEKKLKKLEQVEFHQPARDGKRFEVSSHSDEMVIEHHSGTKKLNDPKNKFKVFYPHQENTEHQSPGIPSNMKLTQANLASKNAFVSEKEKEDVHVAVIDDGVDPNHPYLQGSNVNEVQVYEGYDPEAEHGNMVTGLIVGTDQLGVDSSFTCTVYDVAGTGGLPNEAIKKALDQIEDTDIDVINMSFGSFKPNSTYEYSDELEKLEEDGKILVAAAGNDGKQVEGHTRAFHPSAHSDVISVSALGFAEVKLNNDPMTALSSDEGDSKKYKPVVKHGGLIDVEHGKQVNSDQNNELYWKLSKRKSTWSPGEISRRAEWRWASNWGSSIDVTAPGWGPALWSDNQVFIGGLGTSGATPQVVGTIGLYLAHTREHGLKENPSTDHIRSLFHRTGLKPASGEWRFDQDEQPEPLVNALKAVTLDPSTMENLGEDTSAPFWQSWK